ARRFLLSLPSPLSARPRLSRPKPPPAGARAVEWAVVEWAAAITATMVIGGTASEASSSSTLAAGDGSRASAECTSATDHSPTAHPKTPAARSDAGALDVQNAEASLKRPTVWLCPAIPTRPNDGRQHLARPPLPEADLSYEREKPRGPPGCILHLRQTHDQHGAYSRHLVEIGYIFQSPATR